jgi:hypothetical protein
MLYIGLWQWYINITVTNLDNIRLSIFYLKNDVSETEFRLYLQVERIQMGQVEGASVLSPHTSNTNRVYKANTTQTTNES